MTACPCSHAHAHDTHAHYYYSVLLQVTVLMTVHALLEETCRPSHAGHHMQVCRLTYVEVQNLADQINGAGNCSGQRVLQCTS